MSADDNPELWLQEYGDSLFSFAVMRVSDRNTAEDMVQETFLAAVKSQKQNSFDGRSSRLTWLIGILKRKIADHYRHSARAPSGEQVSLDELTSRENFDRHGAFKKTIGKWPADPTAALQNDEFWTVFHDCRQALPENLLSAFNLRELDQFDAATVCSELGISASNLSVRIFRARLLLRKCLERKWFQDRP